MLSLLMGRNGNSIEESLDSLVKAIGKLVIAFSRAMAVTVQGPSCFIRE